jgi:chromosome segregation ATPase
MFQEVTTTGAY